MFAGGAGAGAGFGAGAVAGLWSFTDTERTMLLIFSAGDSISIQLSGASIIRTVLTNIEYISSATCVEVKRRVTCWAILRLKLANELVKACLM